MNGMVQPFGGKWENYKGEHKIPTNWGKNMKNFVFMVGHKGLCLNIPEIPYALSSSLRGHLREE